MVFYVIFNTTTGTVENVMSTVDEANKIIANNENLDYYVDIVE